MHFPPKNYSFLAILCFFNECLVHSRVLKWNHKLDKLVTNSSRVEGSSNFKISHIFKKKQMSKCLNFYLVQLFIISVGLEKFVKTLLNSKGSNHDFCVLP